MNNLIVDIIPLKVDRLLVESSIKSGGPLMVEGIIQRAGVKNHNGRIYEREILEREIFTSTLIKSSMKGDLVDRFITINNMCNLDFKINKTINNMI